MSSQSLEKLFQNFGETPNKDKPLFPYEEVMKIFQNIRHNYSLVRIPKQKMTKVNTIECSLNFPVQKATLNCTVIQYILLRKLIMHKIIFCYK